MNIRKLTSWAVSRARKDALYALDPELSPTVLAEVFFRKGLEAGRGVLCSAWIGEAHQPCFIGRGVQIVGGKQLFLGRGCIIRDYVLIDAISRGGIRIGDNVTLERYVIMKCTGALRELGESITIGDNSSIGAFSYVGGSGGLTIGKNVLGGQRLGFNPENHVFDDDARPIREQGTTRRGIVIEDDCWLGSGGIFLDGVTVGRGSVVAAGSVVNRDVPAFSVVGGVPARILRSRQSSRPSRQS